jgi:23S rRNA pseudouridine2604 synthase
MATIKLKKPGTQAASPPAANRAPIRGAGSGVKARPTLAQAQAQRAEREALYQEQLRQRFGERPPEQFARRGETERPTNRPARSNPSNDRSANTAFAARPQRDARPVQRPDQRSEGHYGQPQQTQQRPDPRAQQRPPPRQARPPLEPARRVDAFEGRAPQQRNDPRNDQRFDPRSPPRPPARQPVEQDRRARYKPREDDDDDIRDDPPEHAPGSVRLSKRMSELGISSRREADEWIAKGWVRVDDQVVSELGSRVMPDQRVTVDAKAKFMQAQKVTVLVNKPVGYVSGQAEDGYEPAVVLVTPDNLWAEDRSGTRFLREHLRSLVPAGRLDIDSVGLLILTQDGRVAKQLIGEDSEIEKEYLVRVASADGSGLSPEGIGLLRHGLELDGEALRPAQVEWVNDDQLRFVLKQGKKRQIRRMCEAVGLQVLGLKRVRIGKVMLGDLPPGQWRYLRADEGFI